MLALAAALALAVGAPAQNSPALASLPWSQEQLQGVTPGPLALKTLEKLDAIKFEVREEAQREFEGEAIPVRELYSLLWRNTLSAEQRVRLVSAAQLRILGAPRAIIGIHMAPDSATTPGAVIADVSVGVPAHEVLRRNDRIVQVEDSPIERRDDVVSVVSTREPGDTLRVVVVRSTENAREERVEVSVKLVAMPATERREQAMGLPPRADSLRQLRAMQLKEQFAVKARALPVERTQ
jgi:hypothetical protein